MSYEAVQEAGFGHGFGRLEATRELVEWMREYNAAIAGDRSGRVKLQFYGFDMPGVVAGPASPGQVLHFALDYLASVDPAGAQGLRGRIDPLLGRDADWENPMAWRDPAKSAVLLSAAASLRVETEELISALPAPAGVGGQERRGPVSGGTARRGNRTATAQLLRRPGAWFGLRGVARRADALMADNLAYIVGRELAGGDGGRCWRSRTTSTCSGDRPSGRSARTLCTWWPAGSHMNEMFGPRYAVIGSAVGVSADNGLGPPEPGTLEARLTAAPGRHGLFRRIAGSGCPRQRSRICRSAPAARRTRPTSR